MESRDLSDEEIIELHHFRKILNDMYVEDELYWKQRSKQKWLMEGDLNTSYFHKVATNRKKKNLILSMDIEGERCDSLPIIQDHILDFYKNMFGLEDHQFAFFGGSFWENAYCLSEMQSLDLVAPFNEQEMATHSEKCE